MKSGHRERSIIFVTDGTTKFESLISSISDDKFLHLMPNQYTSIVVQYGRGEVVPFASRGDDGDNDNDPNIRCSSYRFKPTLRHDMEAADLIQTSYRLINPLCKCSHCISFYFKTPCAVTARSACLVDDRKGKYGRMLLDRVEGSASVASWRKYRTWDS
jgi:hypothetical protein